MSANNNGETEREEGRGKREGEREDGKDRVWNTN